MIFASVGTQLEFNRMVSILDKWNASNNADVFVQIGSSDLEVKNCTYKKFITPVEYQEYMEKCDLMLAHAGIGSILSALEHKKPIIIFPRRASLGEHRNEHQLATARQFESKKGVYVAYTDDDLISLLNRKSELVVGDELPKYANEILVAHLKDFINS